MPDSLQASAQRPRRAIHRVIESLPQHWVGDGFPARAYLSPHDELARRLSPFLLLDYGGRYDFAATDRRRGVGGHPHRGFETVTLVWEGRIAHHDSNRNAGVIGPGDVQWMTAGSGVLHAEYHEASFALAGGTLHGAQIWVDLPALDKLHPPRYQALVADQIPIVELPGGAGGLRVIAGQFDSVHGPAQTLSPVNMWDVHLNSHHQLELTFSERDSLAVLVIDGDIRINGTPAHDGTFVVFDNDGTDVQIDADTEAHLLILNGKPLAQPIVAHGPFVMNTDEEIHQAITDYQTGRFGRLDDDRPTTPVASGSA